MAKNLKEKKERKKKERYKLQAGLFSLNFYLQFPGRRIRRGGPYAWWDMKSARVGSIVEVFYITVMG